MPSTHSALLSTILSFPSASLLHFCPPSPFNHPHLHFSLQLTFPSSLHTDPTHSLHHLSLGAIDECIASTLATIIYSISPCAHACVAHSLHPVRCHLISPMHLPTHLPTHLSIHPSIHPSTIQTHSTCAKISSFGNDHGIIVNANANANANRKECASCHDSCNPSYLPTCLPACLSPCLSVCPPTYLPACPPACLFAYISTNLRTCLRVQRSISPPVHRSTILPACQHACAPT